MKVQIQGKISNRCKSSAGRKNVIKHIRHFRLMTVTNTLVLLLSLLQVWWLWRHQQMSSISESVGLCHLEEHEWMNQHRGITQNYRGPRGPDRGIKRSPQYSRARVVLLPESQFFCTWITVWHSHPHPARVEDVCVSPYWGNELVFLLFPFN